MQPQAILTDKTRASSFFFFFQICLSEMSLYVRHTSLDDRRAECSRMLARHPNLIPVVLEATGKHAKVSIMALQPTTTVHQLQGIVREVSSLPSKKPVSLLVSGCSASSLTVLSDLYNHCRSDDGFLYMSYAVDTSMGLTLGGACFASPADGNSSSKNPNTKAITAPPVT